jgi:hypothetical protein
MIMRFVVKMSLATLLLACLTVSAQAASLWQLQTGQWMEMEKHDNWSHSWTVRMMVFEEEIKDNGKSYFRVQELNYDPYVDGGDTFSEMYIRSDDTGVYFYNGAGLGETPAFKPGGVDYYWEYQNGSGDTIRKQIVATDDQITLPSGGSYSAYKYLQYDTNDPLNTPNVTRYNYEWVVPGLGYVQEEDHWFPHPEQDGRTSFSAVARVGSNPLFIPMKTGMRLTYDASDHQGNTWKMKIELKEQVTLNDGLTYFHMRQTNYDPIGGDVDRDVYVRCNASQMFARKLDENPAHLEYQAAGPGTAWNYPRNPYTIYKQITDIQPVNVLGKSYLAYVTNQSPDSAFPIVSLMSEFIVPGLGPVEMLDYWVDDPARAPLQFLLTGVTQGSANPAVNLLFLLD